MHLKVRLFWQVPFPGVEKKILKLNLTLTFRQYFCPVNWLNKRDREGKHFNTTNLISHLKVRNCDNGVWREYKALAASVSEGGKKPKQVSVQQCHEGMQNRSRHSPCRSGPRLALPSSSPPVSREPPATVCSRLPAPGKRLRSTPPTVLC